MSLTMFSWLLALSAAVSLSLALFALSRRSIAGALPFALMLSGECIWSAGYWWELRTPQLDGKLFWDNVQFLGTDIGVAGALLFALVYTGHAAWARRYGLLLLIVPLQTLLVVWSDPLHGLLRGEAQLVSAGGQAFLVYDYGPWFWAFVGYSYTLTGITLGLLIAFAAQSPGYRQPALAFVVGFSAPALGALLTVLGLIPIHGLERLDISALTFLFTLPLMTWALFRKRMLDIVPIARTLLVEQMRDAVLVLDVRQRIVDTNAQACRLLNTPASALVGTPISQVLPGLDMLITMADASGLAEISPPQRPQDEFEATMSVLRSRRGQRIGCLVVLRDITAQNRQVRYQRALASCSQILQRAVPGAAASAEALSRVLGLLREAARVQQIMLCRGSLDGDGTLRTWPLAAAPSPAAAPAGPSACLPYDRLPTARAALARGDVVSGPAAQVLAEAPDLVRALERDGARSILIVPLADADGLWGLLRAGAGRPDHRWDAPTIEFLSAAADTIAVAIRQWEAAAALVQARDAAEAAHRAKSAFLSMMSHELRTPLTAIIGYSQLLEMHAAGSNYAAIPADLKHILTASQHLLGMINGVLDFSRIEADTLPLEIGPVDITDLLSLVATAARPLIVQNHNTLTIVGPKTALVIKSDATRLYQVLLNLLDNAAKFTSGGQVTLRAIQDGASVVFEVADTGIGIAEEQFQRLFLPFSQLDDALNRKYGGSGLGLALSRRICQLLGGDISVTSRPGVGSTFIVRLPLSIERNP